jgi:hypothetical protein
MKQCCDDAVGLGGADPDYPRFGACAAEICISARNGSRVDSAVTRDLRRMIDQASGEDADFWKLIRSADALTLLSVVQSEPPEDLEAIKDGYRRAWRHIGSPVKMRSVTEQLEFYEDIFSDGAPDTAAARARAVAWIAQLRAFIESEFLTHMVNA